MLPTIHYSLLPIVAIFMTFARVSTASEKCVWTVGRVVCARDERQQVNAEIRLYDRDGKGIFQSMDPDDLMGEVFTDEKGHFQLGGCGHDRTWFPMISNNPEPYLLIHHYCNDEINGEDLRLPQFGIFSPDTYKAGVIKLDK